MTSSVLAVFGGMLLVPLYLQFVRGEDALGSGLLMAPQGIGAVIAMPIAGILADRIGVGKIVPVGLIAIAGSFSWLTQLSADTPYWQLSIALFALGIGLGLTLMPTMTGALQALPRSSAANANTTLSITQQVGTSAGTAMLTVILANTMSRKLADLTIPGGGTPSVGFADVQKAPPEVFAVLQPILADSFASTFAWALGFVVVALIVAVIVLPKRKPEILDTDDNEGDNEAPVVTHMMG